MLLIYTTTYDTTIDLVIYKMGSENIFRLNADVFEFYKIQIDCEKFSIEDPQGRVATNDNIKKVLWRKPALKQDLLLKDNLLLNDEELYAQKELWYAAREIINLLWIQQKIVLIEPLVDLRIGKFAQLYVGKKYFNIPPFEFRYNVKNKKFSKSIIKSLTMQPIDSAEYKVLYTTIAKENELDPKYPWMVQEYIKATKDITVVFVRDSLFAFELDRTTFLNKTVDWRELAIDETTDKWTIHQLPKHLTESIFGFMNELNLHFGRLDFLFDGENYYFLEVNPNGQWLWLDALDKYGLLKKFIFEIHPKTQVFPIPKRWSI